MLDGQWTMPVVVAHCLEDRYGLWIVRLAGDDGIDEVLWGLDPIRLSSLELCGSLQRLVARDPFWLGTVKSSSSG